MSTRYPAADPAGGAALADGTRTGAVHLTVTDRERSAAFYRDAIGLRPHRDEERASALGAGGEDLVVLHENRSAQPPGRHAGLYHFALLHPSREQLADAALRVATTRTPISGASDHGVSEAIYLPDPDGNGIELYADRRRDTWASEDGSRRIVMYTEPLDLDGLLSVAPASEPASQADDGLTMGHVHLHVADVAQALAFYRDVIGFELMASIPQAAFLSAGGYHHHLGANTWRGEGVPPAPGGAVGLRHWTLLLDGPDEPARMLERVNAAGISHEERDGGLMLGDPSGNAVLAVPAA